MKRNVLTALSVATLLSAGLAPARAAFGPITQISLGLAGAQPNSDSSSPVVNADGSAIAFISSADNLVDNDNNSAADVFIVDRRDGTTARIVGPDGEFAVDSEAPTISDDGRLVAFVNDGRLKVFNRDFGVVQDIVDLINEPYAFSGNGRFLAIAAEDEQQLAADDQNGVTDVYVYDRLTQHFEPVSRPVGGGEADARSVSPAINPDGRYVAFVSSATNLVAQDDGRDTVFVFDRIERKMEAISGFGANEGSLLDATISPAISSDGRFVTYLGQDSTGTAGIYVRDRTQQTTMKLGISGPSSPPDISTNSGVTMSGDARRVVFGLLGDFFEDVYLFDLNSATTIVVSAAVGGGAADGDSVGAHISSNGRAVVFASDAANVVSSGPDGFTMNVFLATPTAPVCQPGDVNGDGVVDAADIPALIQLIFGGGASSESRIAPRAGRIDGAPLKAPGHMAASPIASSLPPLPDADLP